MNGIIIIAFLSWSVKHFKAKPHILYWDVKAIKAIHPYEEPVINVIPLYRTSS